MSRIIGKNMLGESSQVGKICGADNVAGQPLRILSKGFIRNVWIRKCNSSVYISGKVFWRCDQIRIAFLYI